MLQNRETGLRKCYCTSGIVCNPPHFISRHILNFKWRILKRIRVCDLNLDIDVTSNCRSRYLKDCVDHKKLLATVTLGIQARFMDIINLLHKNLGQTIKTLYRGRQSLTPQVHQPTQSTTAYSTSGFRIPVGVCYEIYLCRIAIRKFSC